MACKPNGATFSFRGHKNNAALQVKTSANAVTAQLVNLGAGMDLAKGERREDVKKNGFYRETKHSSGFFISAT